VGVVAEGAVDTLKTRESIYYNKNESDSGVRRTLSLRDALAKVVPNESDPCRRNLERVVELRDDATHFVISEVPRDVLLLFQACVINYHKKLNEWFSVSLGDRITVGMMTIVYDLSPSGFDLNSAVIQRRLGKDVARYLVLLCRAPWKGAVSQRVRIPSGNCRSSR
jgi:hypothetical protein